MKKLKLEDYKIDYKSRLGRGGYGQVYEAVEIKTNEKVAVKIITERRQIQMLKTLNLQHQNIVKYYGYTQVDSKIYIFMELCDCDLRKLIKEKYKDGGQFTQKQCIELIMQILRAFQHLRKDMNFIHRDLKPQNILIKNGILKLTDFGFSTIKQNYQSVMIERLGTKAYIPPQMVKNKKYTDKCDVWSFGCIIYEILHGRLLWEQPTYQKLLKEQKIQINIQRNPISSSLQSFCLMCLKVSQHNRSSWELQEHSLYLEYQKVQQQIKRETRKKITQFCDQITNKKIIIINQKKSSEAYKVDQSGFQQIIVGKQQSQISKIQNIKSQSSNDLNELIIQNQKQSKRLLNNSNILQSQSNLIEEKDKKSNLSESSFNNSSFSMIKSNPSDSSISTLNQSNIDNSKIKKRKFQIQNNYNFQQNSKTGEITMNLFKKKQPQNNILEVGK